MALQVVERVVAASAPGRICLVGESLDWMTRGESVVAAVPLRTTVRVSTSGRGGPVTLRSGHPLPWTRPLPVSALGAYAGDPLDLLQATVKVTAPECAPMLPGAVVESSSVVPVGAGVSSSAAVTVAAAAALLAWGEGRLPDRDTVSRRAFAAESGELHTGAGWMDFLSCAYGGVCVIRPGGTDQPTATRFADGLDIPVLLIDTGQRRTTSRALSDKRHRYAAGEADIMRYAHTAPTLVSELLSALTEAHIDYQQVGAIINAAHALLRDRVHCSTTLIEECVSRCLHAGGYGAKLTGSGHGGCLFALVPWEALHPVRTALAALPVRVSVFTTGEPQGVVFLPSDNHKEGLRAT
jgi:mevalonate kinase